MSPYKDDTSARVQATDAAWGTFFKSRFDGMMDGPYVVGPKDRAETFEHEFNALQKYTVMARQRRNACVGACGLPVEILSNIFAFAQVDWRPFVSSRAPNDRIYYDFGWIYITHVCHAWRTAAIGSAQLWRDLPIIGVPPRMATDMLRRSRRLPLSLSAHHRQFHVFGQRQTQDLIWNWLCEPVLPRVERLSIFASTEEFAQWAPAFAQSMPAVRDLYIDLYSEDGEDSVWDLDDGFLGGQRIHSLTRLSLNNVILSAASPLFSDALTFLSLSASLQMAPHRDTFTLASFRSQLQLMPNLEELRLRDVLPYPQPGVSVKPYLFRRTFKRLHVYVSNFSIFEEFCIQFFRHFSTHSTATVVAVVSIENSLDINTEALTVLTLVNKRNGPQARELWMTQAAMKLSYVERPREEWSTRWDTSATAGPFAPMSDWGIDVGEGRQVYTGHALATAYRGDEALDAVRAINFSRSAAEAFNDTDDTVGLWYAKFDRNAAVNRITVPYVLCEKLFKTLAQLDHDDPDALLLFPSLETIVLYDKEDDFGGELHTALDMAFLDMLDSRREVGAPVRELLVGRAMADWSVWANVGEGIVVNFFD
ncbi:hypothetical protein PENSPDRAFT_654113 [Peniophora sp. CONT]|nr:hypothetical protein PENSPDRAFT_654113 [Peniophora sp. CONT]